MSEQEMSIGLVMEISRQTKNLNLKGTDELVYVFITILKGVFGIGLVLLLLANLVPRAVYQQTWHRG